MEKNLIGAEKVLIKRPCWNCRAEVDDLYFCSHCAALQPLPEEVDYFGCLGLDHRLNIDLKLLEARFYELSRKFHPDFYQKKSQEEKTVSLENAALLNKAYRALKDPLRRVEYLIGLAEGEGVVAMEAPADLFDEIFELQEVLEEIKICADGKERASLVSKLEASKEKFQRRQEEKWKQLERLSGEWDRSVAARSGGVSGFTDEQKKLLGEMKKILAHRAYLERIINDIQAAMGKA